MTPAILDLQQTMRQARTTVWRAHVLVGELRDLVAELKDRYTPDHGQMGSHDWLHHRRDAASGRPRE